MPYAANAGERLVVQGDAVMSRTGTEGRGAVARWPHGTFLAGLAGSPEVAKALSAKEPT